MAPGPLVTVAIVSWNTRSLLRRCLESLQADADSGRAEVWVVDNASSDGSAQLVRDEFPWARLIESDENLGFGRAVNLVARQTSSPWLAAANADVALRPGALDALLEAGARDPGAGAVAPRLVLPGGETQHSVFHFPTMPLALVVGSGLGYALPPLGRRFLLVDRWDSSRPQRVPWAVAAFLLIRRQAWDVVGGFDERQWMYAEDLDLGWRLARAGWATRYEPGAVADHASAAATGQAWGERGLAERWQRASYEWMYRNLGPTRTRAFAALHVVGAAVRYVVLAPTARLVPSPRVEAARDTARWWLTLHRAGAHAGVKPKIRP